MKTKLHLTSKNAFLKPSLFLAILLSLTVNFTSAQISCNPPREVTIELGENGSVTYIAKSAIPNEECFEERIDPESLAISELDQYGDPILWKQQETFTAPGLYIRSIQVLGYNGAGINAPFRITVTGDVNVAPIEIVSETVVDETCTQASGIDLEVTPNDGSVTYLWSNGATTQDISNVEAGDYTVTLSKEGTDDITKTYTVSSTITPLTLELVGTNSTCNGEDNGNIISSVAGGCEPYTYTWNNGDTTANLDSISAGTYSLIVTDSKGSETTQSIAISQPEAITSDIVLSTVNLSTCAYGENANLLYGYPWNNTRNVTINTTTSGGNGDYTYAWEPAEKFDDPTSPNPIFTENTAPNEETAEYELTLTITDANGCTSTQNVPVKAVNVSARSNYHNGCPSRSRVLVCYNGKVRRVHYRYVRYYLKYGACLGSCNDDGGDDEYISRSLSSRNIETKVDNSFSTIEAINVYPNPSKGQFEINLKGYDSAEVLLIDISGKVLQQKTINESVNTSIGNNSLSKGAYFLKVVTADETIVKKLMVK